MGWDRDLWIVSNILIKMAWENVDSFMICYCPRYFVIARNIFISEIFKAIVLAYSFIVTGYQPCCLFV